MLRPLGGLKSTAPRRGWRLADEAARASVRQVAGSRIERVQHPGDAARALPMKRAFDLTLVVLTLPLWLPVLLLVLPVVRMALGRPVFFMQPRVGHHGRVFKVFKLRSMTDERDAAGALLPDAERLTRFGSALRSTSLDELPSLINVLKGEMSLVGPRPLLVEYLPLYTPRQARRHEVLPGVTGWAQVNGRNASSWEQRFEHDLWYVENRSLWLDVRILALTVWKVIRREGIAAEGHVTIQPFTGSACGTPASKSSVASGASGGH